MRLLFTTSRPSLGLAWPELAAEQIVIGPGHLDLDLGRHVFSRRTPRGDYDLAAAIAALPAAQKPDVIACVVDGLTPDLPRNLARCPGPRLLLVGDTQNSPDGLPRLLDYALSESFDRVVFTHGCLDEPIFAAAGLENVFWFPGLLCPVRDWILPIVRQDDRDPILGCAPPTQSRNSALNTGLEGLLEAGISRFHWSSHREERLEQIGQTLAGWVPSERGEWSPELFEVLAAGGLLVTAHLGQGAGLERLWPEGAPLIVHDDPPTLARALREIWDQPESVRRIRSAGAAWYDRFLGDAPRRSAFAALARDGRPAVAPLAPGSSTWAGIGCGALRTVLPATAALQLASEARPEPTAWLSAGTPAACAALVGRFPRLRIETDAARQSAPHDFAFSDAGAPTLSATFLWSAAPLAAGGDRAAFGSVPGITVDGPFIAAKRADDEAAQALDRADYTRAFELAKQAVAARPGDPDCHLILADLFAELGRRVEAERHTAVLRRINPRDPRLIVLEKRKETGTSHTPVRNVARASLLLSGSAPEAALEVVKDLAPKTDSSAVHAIHAQLLTLTGDLPGAAEAWYCAARHDPNEDDLWFSLGVALWSLGRRDEAGFALRRAADHAPHVSSHVRAFAEARTLEPSLRTHAGRERNLVICGSENCQKHGAGVLIKRFFGSDLDTISLRPATYYGGIEEAGGTHLYIPFQGFIPRELRIRLKRLLAPYKVLRILCVPFHRKECLYAFAAQDVTQARLCTYIMDDRNVLIADTDDEILQELFERSSLRLAISSELQMAYTIKYDFDFEVMPPIVPGKQARRTNRWTPKIRPPEHIALVGSVWTIHQFYHLVNFVGRSGVTVDWYGKPPPVDVSKTGINYMGWADEDTLADRLMDYPMVVVPSGMLDGSEDNEWLTRLSLPSRIVFLLQTQTPVLVLGSEQTCASRHVRRLGIGWVIPSNHPNPAPLVEEMTKPAVRNVFLRNAAKAADGFVMPDSGRWIWASTDAGHALPAPFQAFMDTIPEFEVLWPPEAAGRIRISHFELAGQT